MGTNVDLRLIIPLIFCLLLTAQWVSPNSSSVEDPGSNKAIAGTRLSLDGSASYDLVGDPVTALFSFASAKARFEPVQVVRFGSTTRVSVASDGTQGNDESWRPSISADGRYIAFYSASSNLVSGDTNGVSDVFVRDGETGKTTRVSVASDGTQGNGESRSPSISADGRYVAFDSDAANLVKGDSNGYSDVFVHDRLTGETTRVSVASDRTQGNFVSKWPCIAEGGRYVAFDSVADNLVEGDSNHFWDVFLRDRQTGTTQRVSVASDGAQGNYISHLKSISSNGRYVAFLSYSSNLVSGDTNGHGDVFVHDREIGQTTRVSVASNGAEGDREAYDASISADGRYVAFESWASNLVPDDTNVNTDIFVHDQWLSETSRVSVASDGSQADSNSFYVSISADGRQVAFASIATNLVSDDANDECDVFVHDRQTGHTARVSISSTGSEGNWDSDLPSISADGHYVAFQSLATNLVSGDNNGKRDIFVHDRGAGYGYATYIPLVLRDN